jgi:hypothetical protein
VAVQALTQQPHLVVQALAVVVVQAQTPHQTINSFSRKSQSLLWLFYLPIFIHIYLIFIIKNIKLADAPAEGS